MLHAGPGCAKNVLARALGYNSGRRYCACGTCGAKTVGWACLEQNVVGDGIENDALGRLGLRVLGQRSASAASGVKVAPGLADGAALDGRRAEALGEAIRPQRERCLGRPWRLRHGFKLAGARRPLVGSDVHLRVGHS